MNGRFLAFTILMMSCFHVFGIKKNVSQHEHQVVMDGGKFVHCKQVIVNQNVVINNATSNKSKSTTFTLPPTSYEIIDLGTPKIHIEWATSINQPGQVAGMCINDGKNCLFKWSKKSGFVYEIDPRRGMIRTGACPPYINNSGASSLIPINDNGDTYHIDKDHKLRKNNIVIEDSLKWSNKEGDILRVNNSGQVLGLIEVTSSRCELVIWNETDRTTTYINQGFKDQIYPIDINDRGWIAAWFQDCKGNHCVFWTPEMGAKVISNFRPSSLNNSGIISGSIPVKHSPGATSGALWINGQIVDINEAININSNPSTVLTHIAVISNINDLGQMIGWGTGSNPNLQKAIFISPRN